MSVAGLLAAGCGGIGGCGPGADSESLGSAGQAVVAGVAGSDGEGSAVAGNDSGSAASSYCPWSPGNQQADCLVGIWAREPTPCDCPAPGGPDDTAECQSSDCRQTHVLALYPDGEAMRAAVRFSEDDAQLSAIGDDPEGGTWEYFDDGELMLTLGQNVIGTPTECHPGELQPKGQPTLTPAPPGLSLALFWGSWTGDFKDVPYLP